MSRATRHGHRLSRGFSMVEMMVAIVISLILMGGVIQIFASNKATYEVSDDLSRLQENARFAMETLLHDLRMDGYFGCMDNMTELYNHLNGPNNLLDTSSPLDAIDNNDATKWQASGNTTDLVPTIGGTAEGDMVAGTDAVTLKFLDASNPVEVESMTGPAATFKVKSGSGLATGDIVAITDCASADLFQITNYTDSSGNTVHQTGSGSPGNANIPSLGTCPGANGHCFSKIYGPDATVVKLISRRYYIGRNANGNPSLYRVDPISGTNNVAASELVEGVENMQILYGEDTTGDRIPDQYRRADQVNWDNVVSVRVALLLRTPDEVRRADDLDTKTYQVADETVDPVDDRRYRRVFQTSTVLRNLQ